MKVDQKTLEDIALYAAIRGVTILQIGMDRETLAEYNRAAFTSEHKIVLQNAEPLKKKATRSSHPIEIICLDE